MTIYCNQAIQSHYPGRKPEYPGEKAILLSAIQPRAPIMHYGSISRQYRTKNAYRLSTASAAPFFRHSALNSLDNRQVNGTRFAHSDEKTGGASAVLSLCGVALNLKSISVEFKQSAVGHINIKL